MSGDKPTEGESGSVSGVNVERSGTVSTNLDNRIRSGRRQYRGSDKYNKFGSEGVKTHVLLHGLPKGGA